MIIDDHGQLTPVSCVAVRGIVAEILVQQNKNVVLIGTGTAHVLQELHQLVLCLCLCRFNREELLQRIDAVPGSGDGNIENIGDLFSNLLEIAASLVKEPVVHFRIVGTDHQNHQDNGQQEECCHRNPPQYALGTFCGSVYLIFILTLDGFFSGHFRTSFPCGPKGGAQKCFAGVHGESGQFDKI